MAKSDSYSDCYKRWERVIAILSKARVGDVSNEQFELISNCLRAAETEMTKIENQALMDSEAAYEPLTKAIKDRKADLQKVKDEATQIITAAGQAEQLIGLLSKLLPLFA